MTSHVRLDSNQIDGSDHMLPEVKKLFAICVNPLIFLIIGVNLMIGFFIFTHFAIPSIAYTYTIVIMMLRYDTDRHTSKKIDWFDKIDFNNHHWQAKMDRLFMQFMIMSVLFYIFLWFMNR